MIKKNQNYKIFGRTKGRSKKKITLNKYYSLLDKYKFNYINKANNNILDIGIGYGETTIHLNNLYNDWNIFTCDKYIDGNYNLLKFIESNNIKNIKMFHGSVFEILDNFEEEEYFNLISIFFPDPWPKTKHSKRRLISDYFLKKISKYMKANAKIYIATDSQSYLKSILKCIYLNKYHLAWDNQYKTFYSYSDYLLPQTKFYKKAINSGREPFFIVLKKYKLDI